MKDPNKDARTLVSIINQMRVTGQTFNTVAELKSEYLDYAWLFGIQTYKYENKKINYYTLNTK